MAAVVRSTSAACADLIAAHDWYEQRSPGLGKDFVRIVDAAFAGIARYPELFPPVHRGLRRVLIRRFPYAVFYRIDADAVRVIAVLHTAMSLRRLEERS
jgi:plasmid stabilization system protein ParE